MSKARGHRNRSFFRQHSLSIVVSVDLIVWILLYSRANPSTHLGSFFGNAIADWTGLLVTVVATKFLYETGSAESRKPPHHWLSPMIAAVQNHSLTIFLLVTGAGWVWLFAVSDPGSK